MKRLLSAALAGIMLLGAAMPIVAEDAPAGLTLAEGSHLVLDADSKIIDKIDGTISVADLKANFAGEVAVIGADGAAKADDSAVATDDSVGDYKAMIYGDVNRDGKIALADVSGVLQSIAGWSTDVNTFAADVDKTGNLNLSDITKLLKYIAGWDDVSLGNVRWVFENTKLEAANESADLDLFFDSTLIKTGRSDNENTGKNSFKIRLARNESEACQFFVAADKSMEGLTVELTPFEHEFGEGTLEAEIFIHYYYDMTVHTNAIPTGYGEIVESDGFVEPLLPLADSFEVAAGKNQGFNIDLTAGKDAPAGMYKAVLSIKDSEGNELKRANVYAYVWDFTLPDTPYSKSSFGMSGYGIYATLGAYDRKWYSGDDSQTHAAHYEFLLEHNVSAYQLPYEITDSRADALMSDPRVTSFEICGENLRLPDDDDWNQTLANWNKVQSNPVWAEKGHFYYVDEPYEPGYALVKHQHEYITQKLGTDDFDIILPFFNSTVDVSSGLDMLEFIIPYVDIFVPRSDGFHPNLETAYGRSPWTPRRSHRIYGENLDRLKKIQEDPEKELWWYTCIDPGFPYPNLFTGQQGNMNRVIWWQQFLFDTEGFLYWATQSGWDSVRAHKDPGNGDGLLMYLGVFFGYEANIPVASYRLIQVRDGFDDFDYLKIAEELCGREAVMEIVTRLTTDVLKVNEDPAVMEACRDAVAELIEANQTK
ncbi:MAG: DUF4091 domain-containing protein [Clostridia bacterium]|nr:DUF4091 domain-containing protein [Clostridia bacterium]